MPKPIPLEPGRAAKAAKDIARINNKVIGASVTVRRHLCQALAHSVEAANGNEYAADDRDAHLELCRAAGMQADAVKLGPDMPARIAAVLDREEPHARAAGLLYAAAGLMTEAGHPDAAAVRAMAESVMSLDQAAVWRDYATRQPKIIHLPMAAPR